MKPKVVILRGSGTNCDLETASAFRYVGGDVDVVHINEFLRNKKKLSDYDILAIPGGFSYGDDISSGKIFVIKITRIKEEFKRFIESKKPVIGICNGFQILVKLGGLGYPLNFTQTTTLYLNDCGHFLCKWVKVKVNNKSPSIFTRGISGEFYLPIACGEGKFIADENTLSLIKKKNLDTLLYLENPTGSYMNIAGISNEYGNVLGLMPHPERAFFSYLYPSKKNGIYGIGYYFFKNAIDYVK